MQNTWPKIFASTLHLSRVHVLHHVQSHVIPTYTLRSIHVTEFRVRSRLRTIRYTAKCTGEYKNGASRPRTWWSGSRDSMRSEWENVRPIERDRSSYLVPMVRQQWEKRIDVQPMNTPRGIERNVSPFLPFLDMAHMLDRRCTSATRWIRVYGNCHVAWKLTLADFFFSGWNMLFVDDRCRSRIRIRRHVSNILFGESIAERISD